MQVRVAARVVQREVERPLTLLDEERGTLGNRNDEVHPLGRRPHAGIAGHAARPRRVRGLARAVGTTVRGVSIPSFMPTNTSVFRCATLGSATKPTPWKRTPRIESPSRKSWSRYAPPAVERPPLRISPTQTPRSSRYWSISYARSVSLPQGRRTVQPRRPPREHQHDERDGQGQSRADDHKGQRQWQVGRPADAVGLDGAVLRTSSCTMTWSSSCDSTSTTPGRSIWISTVSVPAS